MGNVLFIMSFSVTIASMWLVIYTFLLAPSKEQKYSLLLAVCNLIICTGNLISVGSSKVDAAEVGLHIMFFGGPYVPLCFLLICASICHHKIHDSVIMGLLILNLVFNSVMFSDSTFHFMYKRIKFYKVDLANMYEIEYNFMYYFYIVYISCYFAAMIYVVLNTKKKNPILYKNLKPTLHNFLMTGFVAFLPFIVTIAFRIDQDLSCYGSTLALGFFIYTMRRDRIYEMRQDSSELVINDLDDILLVHDREYHYEYANRQAIETFEVLKYYPYNMPLIGLDERIDRILALHENEPYTIGKEEYLFRRIPVKNNKKLQGYICWLHNQTGEHEYMRQILELKEEAELANKAKSTFLAHVSHEIRTPINAVIGMNELISRESTEPDIITYAGQSIRAGKTLLALINDILDFSKIEAGKMELVTAEYEPSQMIGDITIMTQFRAEEKGLDFIVNIDENLPDTLIGDETRVKQIITNIVTNGVKYTEKGSVTLTVEYLPPVSAASGNGSSDDTASVNSSGILKVTVADTGIGIKQEDMSKLFASFERIENKTTHKTEGTGLGMSIASSLLKIMGGHMDIESEVGKGSTFTIFIPQPKGRRTIRRNDEKESLAGTGRLANTGRSSGKEAPAGEQSSAPVLSDTADLPADINDPSIDTASFSDPSDNTASSYGTDVSSGNSDVPAGNVLNADLDIKPGVRYTAPDARIIIVDDTRTNLFVASSLLKRTKIQIDTASSGSDFIEKARRNKYDAMLVDYKMPGMNGIEAIEKLLSADTPNKDSVTVILTAETDPEAYEMFSDKGIKYSLTKPLDPAYYEAYIAAILPKDKVIYS